MKNKRIFFKISIFLFLICALFLVAFSILGVIKRTGYLSNFNIEDINSTLELNGLNIEKTKKLFTVDNVLDNNAISNYIFTNEAITNYSYNFRVLYYSKVFRNSDLYDVYIDIDKIINDNSFIKEIKINKKGSPFGTLISDKKIDYNDKIGDINYTLSLKVKLILHIVAGYIIIVLFLLIVFCLEKTIINCLKKIRTKLSLKNIKNIINDNSDNNMNIYNDASNSIYKEYIINFLIFFPFVIILYQFLGYSFPYYYAWDSTKILANDILLISNNIMVEFLMNSNFIFFYMYKYIFIPFAKLFNLISILNISELENSLNPYLSYAELCEYILVVQQILFLVFIALLYINVVKIMKIHNYVNKKIILYIISFLFLLSLSIITHTTFIYNTIRFETNGLFLPLISLYFVLLTSGVDIDSKKHRIYIILSGIFIGFALFTKIIFVFYIVFLYSIYIVFNFDKYLNYNNNDNINFSILLKMLFGMLIFSILMTTSIIIYLKNKIATTALVLDIVYSKPEKLILGLCIFPLLSVFLFIFIYLINKNKIYASYKLKILIYNSLIYFFSFILIIFLSLLLPEKLDSIIYSYLFSYGGGSTIMYSNTNNHYLIIALISIVVLSFIFIIFFNIFYRYMRKLIYLVKNLNILKIILSVLLILLSLFLDKFLRNDEKDTILSSTMYIISFFIFYKSLFDLLKCRKLLLILFIFILSVYSVININKFNDYKPRLLQDLNLDKSAYVYTQTEWKNVSYGLNASQIVNIMNKVYSTDELWDSVFYWSKNVQMLKRLLKQVEIKNNSLAYTSIANTNSVISHNSDIISSIDDNIKGGILIPLTDINNNVYLRDDYDFYYISDKEYNKENRRITYLDYDFSVNGNKYFVYKLSMSTWGELNYGYNGNFTFIKDEDFTNAFILINDKLAKKL